MDSKLEAKWIAPIINYINTFYDIDDILYEAVQEVYYDNDRLSNLDDLRATLTEDEYYEELQKIIRLHISVENRQDNE